MSTSHRTSYPTPSLTTSRLGGGRRRGVLDYRCGEGRRGTHAPRGAGACPRDAHPGGGRGRGDPHQGARGRGSYEPVRAGDEPSQAGDRARRCVREQGCVRTNRVDGCHGPGACRDGR